MTANFFIARALAAFPVGPVPIGVECHALEDNMDLTELNKVAQAMVAPGRGILAADKFPAPSRSVSTPSAWN